MQSGYKEVFGSRDASLPGFEPGSREIELSALCYTSRKADATEIIHLNLLSALTMSVWKM
jgi:hypothetical protein